MNAREVSRRNFLRARFSEQVPNNQSSQTEPMKPLSALIFNRAGFGARPGDHALFEALGSDDDSRLEAYVRQQLDYKSINDDELEAKIADAGYVTPYKSRTELWREHWRQPHSVVPVDDDAQYLPALESRLLKFVRAIHSKRQLHEVMTDFWHDHFSVYLFTPKVHSVFPSYDRDAIRPNALGNFRDMLTAVSQSVCMLVYLNNLNSRKEGPNENFPRELLELHTLGAENYYGDIDPTEVPGYPEPDGYCEQDVFEVARALTGWSLFAFPVNEPNADTGMFAARDDWHDMESKHILGRLMPAQRAVALDGMRLLDILASHRGTAKFICRKLVRRFVSDTPPESLVDSAAALFNWHVDDPDQIAKVMEHILLSDEFRQSWGQKMKRPFDAVVSALRAGDCNYVFRPDDPSTERFIGEFRQTGHMPFEWASPDGYPDSAENWRSVGIFVMRWRCYDFLVWTKEEHIDVTLFDVWAQTPDNLRTANALVDYWVQRIFGYALPDATRNILVNFMANGHASDAELPFETGFKVHDRVRALVALILQTKEFQLR